MIWVSSVVVVVHPPQLLDTLDLDALALALPVQNHPLQQEPLPQHEVAELTHIRPLHSLGHLMQPILHHSY